MKKPNRMDKIAQARGYRDNAHALEVVWAAHNAPTEADRERSRQIKASIEQNGLVNLTRAVGCLANTTNSESAKMGLFLSLFYPDMPKARRNQLSRGGQ